MAKSINGKIGTKINFDVIESVDNPGRFEIVDTDTGEVVDNANGYGYKSKPNAYKAGWYKFGGGKKKVDDSESWWRMKEHRAFRSFLEDISFDLMKDSCGDRAEFHSSLKECALNYAKEHNISDFKPEYLKRW